MTLIVDTSAELAGHLAVALRRHRQWAAQQSLRMPTGFAELEWAFTSRATQGQPGTALDDLWEVSQPARVSPILMTYTEAADALACSERQIKRLVAEKTLRPVLVGGLTRLRVADVEVYAASLPAKGVA